MIDRWLVFATLSIIWPLSWLCIFVFNLDARFFAWIRPFLVWGGISAYRDHLKEGKRDTITGAAIHILPGESKEPRGRVIWVHWGEPDKLALPKIKQIEELRVKKDYERCITLMRSIQDDMANSPQFWNNFGVAHFLQGEIKKAQEYITKAALLPTSSLELQDAVSHNLDEIGWALRREALNLS